METQEFNCEVCGSLSCMGSYAEGTPKHCPVRRYRDIVEKATSEYRKPDVHRILEQSRIVTTKGISNNWTRVHDCIEFAKHMSAKRVGIASCVALIKEARDITELFRGAGLEVICVGCHVGGTTQDEMGIAKEWWGPFHTICNPIAQAEIFNQKETDVNYILGLCVGHDALFSKYSDAPAVVIAVKDRGTANNPLGALHCWATRQRLFREYCGEEVGYTR